METEIYKNLPLSQGEINTWEDVPGWQERNVDFQTLFHDYKVNKKMLDEFCTYPEAFKYHTDHNFTWYEINACSYNIFCYQPYDSEYKELVVKHCNKDHFNADAFYNNPTVPYDLGTKAALLEFASAGNECAYLEYEGKLSLLSTVEAVDMAKLKEFHNPDMSEFSSRDFLLHQPWHGAQVCWLTHNLTNMDQLTLEYFMSKDYSGYQWEILKNIATYQYNLDDKFIEAHIDELPSEALAARVNTGYMLSENILQKYEDKLCVLDNIDRLVTYRYISQERNFSEAFIEKYKSGLEENGWECISGKYKLSQNFIEHNYDKINLEAIEYNDTIPYSVDEVKQFIKNGEKAARIETISAVKNDILEALRASGLTSKEQLQILDSIKKEGQSVLSQGKITAVAKKR